MAILWRGIGAAERAGRGRGRVWGKRSGSLVNLLVQPTGKTLADELAKSFFLDAPISSGVNAVLSTTDGADTLTSSAVLALQAVLNTTDAADTLSSTSTLASNAITASLSATDGADTLSSTAALAIQANAAITDAPDVGSGHATLPIQATVGGIEGPDTLSATARLAIVATLSSADGADTLASSASLASTAIVASLNVVDGDDVLVSTATLETATLHEPQFIGDGVYRGHERAAQERTESRDKLKEIVARAYDKVVGVKTFVASPQEAPKSTKAQRRNIAARVSSTIDLRAIGQTFENIEALIREYERQRFEALTKEEDELMIVFMLAA